MISNHITKPIIIIGMHRSGTSLLADGLNDAQIFMGVMREHNGEALHFLSLNQQMISAHNADWIQPEPILDPKIETPTAHQIFAEHIKCRYSNGLRLRIFHNIAWGFKDPRTTFTLGFWLKLFPDARVIHLIRNGLDVAKSLNTRNFEAGEVWDARLNSFELCFALWEKYVSEGIKYQKLMARNYLQLHYEDLVRGDSDAMQSLNKFVGKKVVLNVKKPSNAPKVYPPEGLKYAAQSALMQQLGYRL